MRHTLPDIAFDVPDALSDYSDYSYESPDRSAVVVFQIANDEPADADTLLATARTRYEGMYGPLIIYCSPVTFTRGDGSAVAGVEGEQKDLNNPSKRIRFAIAAIASDRGKAVILYHCEARPDSLRLIRGIIQTIVLLGDPVPPRSCPKRWTRRQASKMLLAVPGDWKGPSTLVFRSDMELRITVAEPFVQEGALDLDREVPEAKTRVLSVKTESLASPDPYGWMGEWVLADATSAQTILRKMSIKLARGIVVTVHGKGPGSAVAELEQAWRIVRGSLIPNGSVR